MLLINFILSNQYSSSEAKWLPSNTDAVLQNAVSVFLLQNFLFNSMFYVLLLYNYV